MQAVIERINRANKNELDMVLDMAHRRNGQLQSSAVVTFQAGDRVRWEHKCQTYEGIVKKRNQKTLSIRSDNGRKWTIAPSFLTKI